MSGWAPFAQRASRRTSLTGRHGRRPTGLLLLFVLFVVVVGAAATRVRGSRADDAVETLRRRVASAPEAARFVFRYERGGTDVLDCVLPNRSFVADVDRRRRAAAFRLAAGKEPVAIVRGSVLLVSRRLFDAPPYATPWLSVSDRADAAVSAAVQRAVGRDLAGYLFANDLPSSGRSLVLAALEVADGVTATGTVLVDGARADRYRITVDPGRFTAAARQPATQASSALPAAVPRFDVAVSRASNAVVHVTVVPVRADRSTGPPEDGWTIEYEVDSPRIPAQPAPRDVTTTAVADATRLSSARGECRLGS
jgi:hypothetical protein